MLIMLGKWGLSHSNKYLKNIKQSEGALLAQAEKELDSGIEYYQTQKPGLGIQFLKEVRLAIERIKLYPEAWQPLSKRTRRCQTKRFPYAVIYQVRSDEILIVAIAHLHRSPDYWQKRVIQK